MTKDCTISAFVPQHEGNSELEEWILAAVSGRDLEDV